MSKRWNDQALFIFLSSNPNSSLTVNGRHVHHSHLHVFLSSAVYLYSALCITALKFEHEGNDFVNSNSLISQFYCKCFQHFRSVEMRLDVQVFQQQALRSVFRVCFQLRPFSVFFYARNFSWTHKVPVSQLCWLLLSGLKSEKVRMIMFLV